MLILRVLLLSDYKILKMLRHCRKWPKQGVFHAFKLSNC